MAEYYKIKEFGNIRELVELFYREYKERNAFEIKRNNKLTAITYEQYYNDINALCTALINAGADKSKVAICADNCYEYCMTYLSVICAGSVIVPIDKELHKNDIFGILEASDSEFLICDRKHFKKLSADERINNIKVYITDFDEKKPCENALAFYDFLESGRTLNQSGKELYKQVQQDTNKLCTLLFTSGTTGVAKGVMLCQRNFVFEIKAVMKVIKITPDDCAISMLPFHHTFESSLMIFVAPYCGAKIAFCEGIKHALRNMKEFRPTVFVAVPLILETVHKRILREIRKKNGGELKFRFGKALCKYADKVHIDLKKVIFKDVQNTFGGRMRLIVCGGAPIDPQIIKDFDSFGIQVAFGYGLTECAPLAIINHDHLRTSDSIGQPMPGVQAKIYNPDKDGVGEVLVKGDMVMLGYYKNPEATAEVIGEDGFFHTGDLGFVDANGCYHITGRCKNVIVTSNGKNIYPEELEYHLDSDRFIYGSMVEGIDNGKGDLSIHAQVVPDIEEITLYLNHTPDDTEVNEIVKHKIDEINEKLPGFKRIRSFTVRTTDFVRTTAKKIKREDNKTTK